MTTTDPRARLNEIKAEHQPEAWEADAFEYGTSGIGCTGCECGECGNIGDFDGPCPTSAMAAALLDVLDLLDNADDTVATQADGVHIPVYLIRRKITDNLPGGIK